MVVDTEMFSLTHKPQCIPRVVNHCTYKKVVEKLVDSILSWVTRGERNSPLPSPTPPDRNVCHSKWNVIQEPLSIELTVNKKSEYSYIFFSDTQHSRYAGTTGKHPNK